MEYTQPEMEIVAFETDDIIATSSIETTGVTSPSYIDPDDSIGGELG